jgi:hypothetical protein
MSDSLVRLGILVLAIVLITAIVLAGRLFVEHQRRLALAALPLTGLTGKQIAPGTVRGRVRILAFSSADCTQCHTLQEPVLRRLQELRGEKIEVVEVDAPGEPELVHRYHILTVPSTVVLDAAGEAHAVNYGFANFSKLQQQVDAILALVH